MLSFQPSSDIGEFIAYLNAEIRLSDGWEWDENASEDGGVIEEVWWTPVELDFRIRLTLRWSPSGALETLSAEPVGGAEGWREVLQMLFERADQRAHEAYRQLYDTQHKYAYIGWTLSGSFEFGSIRLEPWSVPDGVGAAVERIILVSFPYGGTDHQDAISRSHTLASEFAAFLSVVLRAGFYIIRREGRWTVDGRKSLAFPFDREGAVPAGTVDASRTAVDFDRVGARRFTVKQYVRGGGQCVERCDLRGRKQQKGRTLLHFLDPLYLGELQVQGGREGV